MVTRKQIEKAWNKADRGDFSLEYEGYKVIVEKDGYKWLVTLKNPQNEKLLNGWESNLEWRGDKHFFIHYQFDNWTRENIANMLNERIGLDNNK